MPDIESFWQTLHTLTFSSESDVELRLVTPFLQALGWPLNQIYTKVPVEFRQGRKTGRKPEADFVLAAVQSATPRTGWVVVEAKTPGESLDDAELQAHSYSYMLRAPLFVTTNGQTLQIWQTGWYTDNRCVFDSDVARLNNERGLIESLLTREAVEAYIEQHILPPLGAHIHDLRPYLEGLYRELQGEVICSRTLSTAQAQWDSTRPPPVTDTKEQQLTARPDSDLELANRDRWLIQGWGGRGKTMMLKLLALQRLRSSSQARVPLIVSLDQAERLFDHLAEQLRASVPALGTRDAVLAWLRVTPSLLLLDNWDKLGVTERAGLISDLKLLSDAPCAVVMTSRPHVTRPSFPFTAVYQLSALRPDEQWEFLEEFFGAGSYLLQQAVLRDRPPPLKTLLTEPLYLAFYAELVRENRGHPPQAQDPEALMSALLHSTLTSRHDDVEAVLARIYAVCGTLVQDGAGMTLPTLREALLEIGETMSPATFAADLQAAGLWGRQGETYIFTHDVWRIYFLLERQSTLITANPTALAEWIRACDLGDLNLAVPILLPKIQTTELRDQLLAEVLQRDLRLYLLLLAGRTDEISARADTTGTVWMTHVLEGLDGIATRYFPKWKWLLPPWHLTQRRSFDTEPHLVIAGRREGNRMHYALGLTLDTDRILAFPPGDLTPFNALERVEFDWSGWTEYHSGRHFAAERLLKAISQRCTLLALPPARWVVRERFVMWVRSLHWQDASAPHPQSATVGDVLRWVEPRQYVHARYQLEDGSIVEGQAHQAFHFRGGRAAFGSITDGRINYDQVSDLARYLIGKGEDHSPLSNFLLPGPDLDWHPDMKRVTERYTRPQIVAWTSALYNRALETYAELCQVYFPEVKSYFWYDNGPWQAQVTLHFDQPGFGGPLLTHTVWYKAASTWTEGSVVIVSQADARDVAYTEYRRALHAGRGSSTFSNGLLNVGSEIASVTELVTKWLQDDLLHLAKILDRNAS